MAGNKFGAKKIKDPATGFIFDSKAEFIRWCELRILERAGKITDLQRQEKFVLIPAQYITVETGGRYKRNYPAKGIRAGDPKTKEVCLEQSCVYIADFVYKQDGITIVEDTKGYKKGATYDLFVIKRKLMLWVHGIKIKET